MFDPPDSVILEEGKAYRLRTDFRTGMAYQTMLLHGSATVKEVLDLWFPGDCPADSSAALEAVNEFYRCGDAPSDQADQNLPMPYAFEADSAALIAAFQREYNIDLSTAKMHWWRFSALLRGLMEHSFSERVQYRVCDLGKIRSKELRDNYSKLKQQFALDAHGRKRKEPTTVEEYEAMIMAQIRGGEW